MKAKDNIEAKKFADKAFKEGDRVWVRNYRSGQKWVQGKVLGKIGKTMYQVKVDKGTWRRHVHQLRTDKSQFKDYDIPSLPGSEMSHSSDTSVTATDQLTPETVTRRYPLRDRKPTKRFEFST